MITIGQAKEIMAGRNTALQCLAKSRQVRDDKNGFRVILTCGGCALDTFCTQINRGQEQQLNRLNRIWKSETGA